MRTFSLLVLIALAAIMAQPAMAAEEKTVDLYAQIWFDGWYETADKNVGRYTYGLRDQSENLAYNNVKRVGYNATDFTWGLNPIVTRFGANFKKDNLTGRVEIRPMESGGNSAGYLPRWASLIREWWAQYEFKSLGGTKVLVGQTYCPLYAPVYMMAQGGQNRWAGDMRPEDRTPMIQVAVPLGPDKSVLKFAAIQPVQGKARVDNPAGTTNQQVDGDATFFNYYQNPYPKFELAYNLNMKRGIFGANVTAGVGYQETKAVRQPTSEFANNEVSQNIPASIYGISSCFNIGPAILRGSFHAMKNGKEFGDPDVLLGSTTNASGSKIYGTDSYGYHLVAGAQFGMFTPYVSYGKNYAERKAEAKKYEMAGSWFSVGALIKPHKTIVIQPEIAFKDNGVLKVSGASDQNLGKQVYYGLTFVIYL
jgi:hypothetical protein